MDGTESVEPNIVDDFLPTAYNALLASQME